MDAAELKAMQAPLKEAYREDASRALITLQAKGSIDDQSIACKVETGRALAIAGLHPATGGSGMELCSGDMLLGGAGRLRRRDAESGRDGDRLQLGAATVAAEGDLDFRGTLGVAKDAPVGFRAIRLHVRPRHRRAAGADRFALKLTERYCVVFQTINTKPVLSVSATA